MAIFFLLLMATSIVYAADSATDDGAPDAALIAAGRGLYRGTAPFSETPRLGDVALPPPAAVCLNCHGARGQGRREAGVDAPAITWQRLQASRTRPTRQPGYRTSDDVLRAIERGDGRGGSRLSAPMPTYTLTGSERNALIAYLKVLGTEDDLAQGVSADRIVVGSALPLSGPMQTQGQQIQAGLQKRFDAINHSGGIFGRKLVLMVEDSGGNPDNATRAVQRLMTQHHVFALVGSLLPELASGVRVTAQHSETPMVANLAIPLDDGTDSAGYNVTYLLPSLSSQLQQLRNQLSQRCKADQGTLVLYAPLPGLAEKLSALASMDGNLKAVAWRDAEEANTALASTEAQTVIALLPGAMVDRVREQLSKNDRTGSGRCLGTLAMLSGASDSGENRNTSAMKIDEVVTLPMAPKLTGNDSKAGEKLWYLLGEIAASTLAEALARTGRLVEYDGFERAVNSLQGFEPVAGLPLNYSQHQRHGLSVAHIWKGEHRGN